MVQLKNLVDVDQDLRKRDQNNQGPRIPGKERDQDPHYPETEKNRLKDLFPSQIRLPGDRLSYEVSGSKDPS